MNQSKSASDPGQFRKRLEERIGSSRQEPKWRPADMAAEMQRFQERRVQFDQVAPRLVADVILPRLSQLASMFTNASLCDRLPNDRASCWFGYCERFPSSAKIELIVSHDAPVENVIVRFEASIFPSYQRFEPHDKLLVPLVKPDEAQVAHWVEDRLVEFIDGYLRIDRGMDDFDEEVVTDPVCGMRLVHSETQTQADYRGHAYLFCSEACREQFLQQPERYVLLRGT